MGDLEINDLELEREILSEPIDTRLFKPPFRALFIAPSFSGKSVIIANFLSSYRMYKDKFVVHFFSRTFNSDDLWRQRFEIEEFFVHDNYDENYINNVLDFQDEMQGSEEGRKHHLFIFDDLINEIKDSRGDITTKLFFKSRHRLISIIMTSQSYNAVPKKLRLNSTFTILFPPGSNDEIKNIAKENSFDLTTKEFEQMFRHVTEEPFAFLLIHRAEPDRKKKFRKNLDTIVTIENGEVVEKPVDRCKCKEEFDGKLCFNCKFPNVVFKERKPKVTPLNQDFGIDFN